MPECYLCKTSINNPLTLGEIKTYRHFNVHYYCLLLSTTITQSGQDDEGILGFLPGDIMEEAERSVNRVCTYCKKFGASVKCCQANCNIIFHLPCGIQNGAVPQFRENFPTYCAKHRSKQKYSKPRTKQICVICYDSIDFNNRPDILWAPCCKKSFFHKICLQKMALNAGYYFKCPICNNKKLFRKTMKRFGIFVPDCDASWEEQDAFEDLHFRHGECNATICQCEKGRRYEEINSWDIVLCDFCGSQGTHIICSGLRNDQIWTCNRCKINNEINEPSTSSTSQHPETLDTNSEGPIIEMDSDYNQNENIEQKYICSDEKNTEDLSELDISSERKRNTPTDTATQSLIIEIDSDDYQNEINEQKYICSDEFSKPEDLSELDISSKNTLIENYIIEISDDDNSNEKNNQKFICSEEKIKNENPFANLVISDVRTLKTEEDKLNFEQTTKKLKIDDQKQTNNNFGIQSLSIVNNGNVFILKDFTEDRISTETDVIVVD